MLQSFISFIQVLGSLVTHTGSGVAYEVNSALDTLVLLATKHPQELLPVSSYINGFLFLA